MTIVMRVPLLLLAWFGLVESQNTLTFYIGQSGTDTFLAWNGQIAAPPDGTTSTTESGFSGPRYVTDSNQIIGTTHPSGQFERITIGSEDPVTWDIPSLPSFNTGATPIGVASTAGYSSGGSGSGYLFFNPDYDYSSPITGCVVISGSIAGFADLTNHVAVSWDPAGAVPEQQMVVNFNTADQPLPDLCGGSSSYQTAGGSGGSGGDPHFQTWSGEHYDFHGHCDLVLLQNDEFQVDSGLRHGKGLSVHIRSAPFKSVFSFISGVAIKIGNDVLDIGQRGVYYVNGVAQAHFDSIGGCPVQYEKTQKRGNSVYKIHLGKNTWLIIREQKGWFRVKVSGADAERFGSSYGLMGSFGKGIHYARDGQTVLTEMTDFGQEWQVRESDGLLFQTPSPYQEKCEVLSEADFSSRGRRLAESFISRQQAAEACSQWNGSGLEDCILDVMVSEDLELAELGPY